MIILVVIAFTLVAVAAGVLIGWNAHPDCERT